jgi:hypothetical protein
MAPLGPFDRSKRIDKSGYSTATAAQESTHRSLSDNQSTPYATMSEGCITGISAEYSNWLLGLMIFNEESEGSNLVAWLIFKPCDGHVLKDIPTIAL